MTSKTVIIVLITTVLKNLDSIKYFYLPNRSAQHTECMTKRKNRELCSTRFDVESINFFIYLFIYLLLSFFKVGTT